MKKIRGKSVEEYIFGKDSLRKTLKNEIITNIIEKITYNLK